MIFNWLRDLSKKGQEKIFGFCERCYSEQEYSGKAAMGLCDGFVEGSLAEQCITCPHLWKED